MPKKLTQNGIIKNQKGMKEEAELSLPLNHTTARGNIFQAGGRSKIQPHRKKGF